MQRLQTGWTDIASFGVALRGGDCCHFQRFGGCVVQHYLIRRIRSAGLSKINRLSIRFTHSTNCQSLFFTRAISTSSSGSERLLTNVDGGCFAALVVSSS